MGHLQRKSRPEYCVKDTFQIILLGENKLRLFDGII